jgi:hypothetical protein
MWIHDHVCVNTQPCAHGYIASGGYTVDPICILIGMGTGRVLWHVRVAQN